mmetsp:Transcript_48638/g.155644  ORF Transcript_48638/g.155644 Transcript_48638/m.155644 type:complete len:176 (-) Transcript_48638:237-764(-)
MQERCDGELGGIAPPGQGELYCFVELLEKVIMKLLALGADPAARLHQSGVMGDGEYGAPALQAGSTVGHFALRNIVTCSSMEYAIKEQYGDRYIVAESGEAYFKSGRPCNMWYIDLLKALKDKGFDLGIANDAGDDCWKFAEKLARRSDFKTEATKCYKYALKAAGFRLTRPKKV